LEAEFAGGGDGRGGLGGIELRNVRSTMVSVNFLIIVSRMEGRASLGEAIDEQSLDEFGDGGMIFMFCGSWSYSGGIVTGICT
jgi:hypothetical protein